MSEREMAHVVSAEQVTDQPVLSQEFLLTAIEASYDGIYITDGGANTVMINKSYETISGLERWQLIGRNMRELVEEQIISQSGTLVALETGESITLEQTFATGKQAVITSTPIFDRDGKITMVFTNVRDVTELRSLQERLVESTEQNQLYTSELESLRSQMGAPKELVAVDIAMQNVLQLASRVAKLDTPVLLVGENGVGKRELARYIVSKSPRKRERYVLINCAAGQDALERDLFGCAAGVDPSAPDGKKSLLELASGGTVLLDEVGDLPMDLQLRVFNFLQTHQLERAGGLGFVYTDVLVLASTSRNLKEMVEQGQFRKDLYYQLDVLPIRVPPLRERRDDILPLVDHLSAQFNKKYRQKKRFTPAALLSFKGYDWPGNLRELRNVVERAMIMSPQAAIDATDLPVKGAEEITKAELADFSGDIDLRRKLEELELVYIQEAYQKHGNVRAAAKSLGLDPSTFVRKRKKLENSRLLQE